MKIAYSNSQIDVAKFPHDTFFVVTGTVVKATEHDAVIRYWNRDVTVYARKGHVVPPLPEGTRVRLTAKCGHHVPKLGVIETDHVENKKDGLDLYGVAGWGFRGEPTMPPPKLPLPNGTKVTMKAVALVDKATDDMTLLEFDMSHVVGARASASPEHRRVLQDAKEERMKVGGVIKDGSLCVDSVAALKPKTS